VSTVKIEGGLAWAQFVRRITHFLGSVRLDGREKRCHTPNPGRLKGLVQEAPKERVREAQPNGNRSTPLDLLAARDDSAYVTVDSRLPNLAAEESPGLEDCLS